VRYPRLHKRNHGERECLMLAGGSDCYLLPVKMEKKQFFMFERIYD
jgi:hypothetical protein